MNRLVHAQSLYLRKHATNPIDWWTWSDEALETAKKENLPIFLSIGYSSCHAMGLVCQGLSCQIPANSWEQLQEQVCYESARCSGVQT